MTLLLDENDIRQLLPMPDVIDLMEGALASFSTGRVVQPVRSVLPIDRHRAFLGVMPGYDLEAGTLAVKLVSFVPGNAGTGRHTHLATILLFDPATGERRAIMDGRWITETRTAAVSAASARRLAAPGASTLGILGSGVQAASHLAALLCVLPVSHVRVFSPDPGRREAFARDAALRHGIAVTATGTAEAAVRGAALVVTATSSREPVLRGEWLARGSHVMAVGACRPDGRELDAAAVARSRVFVDSLAAARIESGDLILAAGDGTWSWDWVAGELGGVFSGHVQGREAVDQITLFESLGMAIEDAVCARLACERALVAGVGRRVTI